MIKIEFEISNDTAQMWAYFLRKRYNKKTNTNLNKLVELAILREVSAAAQEIVDKTIEKLDRGEKV